MAPESCLRDESSLSDDSIPHHQARMAPENCLRDESSLSDDSIPHQQASSDLRMAPESCLRDESSLSDDSIPHQQASSALRVAPESCLRDESSLFDDSIPHQQASSALRMAPESCLRDESISENSFSVSDAREDPPSEAEGSALDDEWVGARAAPCLRNGPNIFEWRPRVEAYRRATGVSNKAEEPVHVAKSVADGAKSLATPPAAEGTESLVDTPPAAEGAKSLPDTPPLTLSAEELSVLPRYYGPHRTFLPKAQNVRCYSLSRLLTSLAELDVTAMDGQGEMNINLRMELSDLKRGISIYHNRLVLLSRHRESVALPAPSYATMCEKLPQLWSEVSTLSPHKQRRSLLRACLAMVQAAAARVLDVEGYLQSTSTYLRTVEDQLAQNLKSRKKCSGALRMSLEQVQQLQRVHATPATHLLLTPHWVSRRLAMVQHPTFQPLKLQLAALAPRVQSLGVEGRQRYNEVHVRARQRQEATRWRRLSAMNRRAFRNARREREREETRKLVSAWRSPHEVCHENGTSASASPWCARQPLGYADWAPAQACRRTPGTASRHRGLERRRVGPIRVYHGGSGAGTGVSQPLEQGAARA